MPRKQSFRLRFTFWLDMLIPEEQGLADYVAELKTQRSFVRTIRDGLRLMRDLRAGSTDVLFELFPFVRQQLVPPPPQAGDAGDLKRELDELKELLLRSTTPPLVAAARSAAPLIGPKPLGAPKFDLPTFDDEDDTDTLILAKDTRTDSALNFLNSMLALQ